MSRKPGDKRELTVVVAQNDEARQYRIPRREMRNVLTEHDNVRFANKKEGKVNFAFSEIETNMSEIEQWIGKSGLRFVRHFTKKVQLLDGEQLILVNRWTVIVGLTRSEGDFEIDTGVLESIGAALRCEVQISHQEDAVGAIFTL